jgi:drug/metabolite transporter (DMT)-like permease
MLTWELRNHPRFKAYVALVAVCFFWGTTYLGIRMALESFPPLVLVCARYLISGSLMLLVAVARGDQIPRGREFWTASFSGILTLGIGNGCLAFAELLIPSGLAGLILTISPFWMVGVEALLPRGERLHAPAIFGMIVGLFGAALLFAPGLQGHSLNRHLLHGFLILQLGMAGWSFGSLYQRRQVVKAHPVVVGAVQQLATGLAYIPLAGVFPGHPIQWTLRGAGAVLYLVLFGSIVGYSAYVYSLDRLPVAVVSVYPYVNAVVAVALGWLIYREPFGLREASAMAIIFAGVALVKWHSRGISPRLSSVLPSDLGPQRSARGT